MADIKYLFWGLKPFLLWSTSRQLTPLRSVFRGLKTHMVQLPQLEVTRQEDTVSHLVSSIVRLFLSTSHLNNSSTFEAKSDLAQEEFKLDHCLWLEQRHAPSTGQWSSSPPPPSAAAATSHSVHGSTTATKTTSWWASSKVGSLPASRLSRQGGRWFFRSSFLFWASF